MAHAERTREFLATLIQTGFQSPAPRFKQEAMESLRGLIPFDMALWASGRTHELTVHNVYLHNLPPALMDSWERIKYQDRLLASILASPGITFDVYDFYARRERQELAVYQAHSKLFGIEAAISTAVPNPNTGLVEIMSLYRRDRDHCFTAEERRVKQFVFPLMIEAWHGNQIGHLRSKAGGEPGGALAICDRQWWIRNPEERFVDLLRREWPDCRAPMLPEELAGWLTGAGKGPFKGKRVVLLKTGLDDMILLQAHPRGAIALLTPREEDIAESYSAGLTYRDIALEYALSPSTVRRHIESIYRKLGVANKVELHRALNEHGIGGNGEPFFA